MRRFIKTVPALTILALVVLALVGPVMIAAPAAQARDQQTVLPRKIVQVAEIPLMYRDDDALKYRHRGRLLYWDENNVRVYARREELFDLARKRNSRCPFDDDNIRLTLELTLEHIPDTGRDVDLVRYYKTFIVGVLHNDERMELTVALEKTMEAWERNLQDVIRILGAAGARQGMGCLAMLGQVAAQDIETETFHDRLYWRQDTNAKGKPVKYFFTANTFFQEQAD